MNRNKEAQFAAQSFLHCPNVKIRIIILNGFISMSQRPNSEADRFSALREEEGISAWNQAC